MAKRNKKTYSKKQWSKFLRKLKSSSVPAIKFTVEVDKGMISGASLAARYFDQNNDVSRQSAAPSYFDQGDVKASGDAIAPISSQFWGVNGHE